MAEEEKRRGLGIGRLLDERPTPLQDFLSGDKGGPLDRRPLERMRPLERVLGGGFRKGEGGPTSTGVEGVGERIGRVFSKNPISFEDLIPQERAFAEKFRSGLASALGISPEEVSPEKAAAFARGYFRAMTTLV